IVRQLAEGAGSQQVGAAVADVAEVRALFVDGGGRQRRAHAGDLAVRDRTFEDGAVGGADHLGKRCLSAAEQLLDGVQCEARGDGAAARASHAVGDGVERRLDQVRVLVAFADASDVRSDADDDPHRRSSNTVVPTRILSPGCTMAGAASFWSFTNVPFVEPKSSTYHVPFLPKMRACCDEAYVSSISSSHSGARPIVMLGPILTVRALPSGGCTTTALGPVGTGTAPPLLRVFRPEGEGSTVSPRTAQRIERQTNRNSSANRPYFNAESANGVTRNPRGTPASSFRS